MISDSTSIRRILLIRTDRIGDVVLSLPMLPVLKKKYPSASISVLVRPYTRELVAGHSCVDEVLLWEEERGIGSYVSLLRKKQFDMAIIPYPRFNLALIIFLAGIPHRIGTGYRWYSFLFNIRHFEHRKNALHHEAEYNLRLLGSLGITPDLNPQFEFTIREEEQALVDSVLASDGITRFAVLHAGSGGSARDWSAERFAELGDELQRNQGLRIVLTGGKDEKELVASVQSLMKTGAVNYSGRFSLRELAALFARASVFVSNSTGPLHIASMVGTPVAAMYPPIVQCSPARWGPYTNKKRIFAADNTVCDICRGGACRSDHCMDQITVDKVALGIRELLHEQ